MSLFHHLLWILITSPTNCKCIISANLADKQQKSVNDEWDQLPFYSVFLKCAVSFQGRTVYIYLLPLFCQSSLLCFTFVKCHWAERPWAITGIHHWQEELTHKHACTHTCTHTQESERKRWIHLTKIVCSLFSSLQWEDCGISTTTKHLWDFAGEAAWL